MIEICDYETKVLNCEWGETLLVMRALNGQRPNDNVCDYDDTLAQSCNNDVTTYLQGLCSGRDVCELNGGMAFPGESTCPDDVRAYYEVTYECGK